MFIWVVVLYMFSVVGWSAKNFIITFVLI